jgi:flagellar M-ring protein FliF
MNARLFDFWSAASTSARLGLGLAAAAILALAALAAAWALKADYQPLFSDLDPRDASAITAELDRMKVPYEIGDDGAAILVDKGSVHATRLKVMGKGVDLKGTVGFEIFNNTDFGMTEFAQKINYQRALQGELARTIGALDEVKSARVHLVLPESGLLRRSAVRPKASVTLAMRNGQRLSGEQIQGVQRLVAAAVPEMDPGAVTVLDQQGIALSRRAPAGPEGESDAGRLDAKRDVEAYLSRKVAAVLDQAFGPGRAIVSVDVALNHDQVKVTREEVLPASAIVRRKDTAQRQTAEGVRPNGANTSEVEYQLGRKVEQIVSAPGGVRHIRVGVLLPAGVEARQVESLREVIAMAAGLNPARGDALAFSWVQVPASPAPERQAAPLPPARVVREAAAPDVTPWIAAAAVALLLALLLLARRRPRAPQPALLSPKQRDEALVRLKSWIASGEAQP